MLGTRFSRKAAFTLMEVMVVIVIVGLLAAFLMPALTRAIAKGRLTQCMNNQYQVAFALVHYNEKQGSIPGWLQRIITTSATAASGTAGAPCCWAVPLLPFLGRSDVYDTWPLLPNSPVIATFACPANRPSKPPGYPLLHYAANIGANGTDWHDGVFLNLLATGVRAISLDDIADADGTSTTVAFAEKSALGFQPHTWTYAKESIPEGSVFGSGTVVPPVFGVSGTQQAFPLINSTNTRSFAPASTHDGGVVVAFCDGHTAFLKNDLKPYEYGQLLTPRSRWIKASPTSSNLKNITNFSDIERWLVINPTAVNPRFYPNTTNPWVPYILDEKVIKQ